MLKVKAGGVGSRGREGGVKQRFKGIRANSVHFSEPVYLYILMYLVFTRMSGEIYRRRLRSLLLSLCDVFPCMWILFTH